MFWICDETNIDNTLMFLLLQSSAYTEPGSFQPLLLPDSEPVGGAQGAGRGHSQDS